MLATIGDIVSGRKPSQAEINPLVIPSNGSGGTAVIGDAPSSDIAEIGKRYIGHPYLYGGAPGKDGSRPWDCSSFVNYVVGVKARRSIPGNPPGRYTGSTHGPTTGVWAAWTGMDTIKRSEVRAGDILVWVGHMGIAISNTQMVHAANPQSDTVIGSIDGVKGRGALVRIGRLR